MQKKFNQPGVGQCSLFSGIGEEEVERLLVCMEGKEKKCRKQELLLMEDEPADHIGIVLEGCVQVVEEDVWGNRGILEQIEAGGLYGAAFACAGIERSPVNVVAVTDSRILRIKIEKVMGVCSKTCACHQQVIRNLVHLLARKNVALSEKLQHISQRSIREKLLAYLADEAKKSGRKEFTIPFNRQELADYLCVDRSAMSTELWKLKREGIIGFQKNKFRLL